MYSSKRHPWHFACLYTMHVLHWVMHVQGYHKSQSTNKVTLWKTCLDLQHATYYCNINSHACEANKTFLPQARSFLETSLGAWSRRSQNQPHVFASNLIGNKQSCMHTIVLGMCSFEPCMCIFLENSACNACNPRMHVSWAHSDACFSQPFFWL